ncbi:COQ9 family protein [Telmatospirillum siberiense]|uniref:COQ9 family protein n=1 Tax=Telmatospirillum siberiense TaxID=382514 RepID=A0A2N3Q0W1_9PROT|nr:COQ9 family protein [Telmatospirillum siberiense]PKU26299.1 COQ9 family protein [Telmatospirillum siberiense]
MSNAEKWRDLRDQLVLATLDQVPFEGWSPRALQEAAKDLALDPTIAERLFPGGALEAIDHFTDLADRRLLEVAAANDLAGMRRSERIRWLIRQRIEAWAGHRESVRRAVTFLTLPTHGHIAARSSWRTADTIWYASGDAATDFSYYTKRATVAAVYTGTLLYWLQDDSEDFADSWAFLDRRLADALKVTRLRTTVEKRLGQLPNPVRLFLTRAGEKRRFGIRQV